MSLPLRAFWFEPRKGAWEIFFSVGIADNPSKWRFALFSPAASYRMAVAVSSSIGSIMQVNLRTVEIANLSAMLDTPSAIPAALAK